MNVMEENISAAGMNNKKFGHRKPTFFLLFKDQFLSQVYCSVPVSRFVFSVTS
jgi:hypothetical protein